MHWFSWIEPANDEKQISNGSYGRFVWSTSTRELLHQAIFDEWLPSNLNYQ